MAFLTVIRQILLKNSLMTVQFRLVYALIVLLVPGLLCAGCTQSVMTAQETQAPQETVPVSLATTAPAAATKETMVAFVNEAVAYAGEHGKTVALAEFSDPNGSFVRGELYIYAYDFDGLTLAHPFNPEKIGVNRLNESDAMGTFFIRNLRDAAINDSGFVTFAYINPVHNRTVEQKLGYVKKVDDTWFLGSGIYNGTSLSAGTP